MRCQRCALAVVAEGGEVGFRERKGAKRDREPPGGRQRDGE